MEKFKKIREDNEKEKESLKEKKKKELFEIKKVGFIENNKRLLKRIKEKEVKKTYKMLRKMKNQEQKCIINVNKPTEELKLNLDKDDMKLLNIDEDEENSDEEILEKYGVPRNKKVAKKDIKTIDDGNKTEDKEIKNIQNIQLNTPNKDNKNMDSINNNNNNNNTLTNDILSGESDSNTNASEDIMTLKQNLKPKKKENIYFSSNNKKEEIKDEDKEKKKKLEKEKEKLEEKEIKNEKNEINDKIGKKKEVLKNINKDENINKRDVAEGIYLTEPDVNKFRNRMIPAKNLSPKKSLAREIIQLRSKITSNSLEMKKKINKNILSKFNKIKEKEELEEKGNYNLNNSMKKGKINEVLSPNKSFDKISIKTNNINNMKNIGTINKNNEKKSRNSINKKKKESFINKDNNNNQVIKLPSVNKSSLINARNNMVSNKSDGVIVLPDLNPQKTLDNITNSKVIVLPGIISSKNIETISNINSKDNPTSDNKRYLLFQKNYNKDSKINKSLRSNIIKSSEEKEKNINLNRRSNKSLANNIRQIKNEVGSNKKK